MMVTRFQRHIGGGAACRIARGAQGMNFCMRFASFLVPAFADNFTAIDQDAANAGIWQRRE